MTTRTICGGFVVAALAGLALAGCSPKPAADPTPTQAPPAKQAPKTPEYSGKTY